MTCSEISKSTPLYLSGELEPVMAGQFADHLKSCADCRLYVERDAEIDRLIRESMVNEAADAFSTDRRVRARIRAERQIPRRRWLMAGAGIAAGIAMAVVAYRMAARPNAVYAAAARDHLVELVQKQPRKWTTDPGGIAQLATRVGLTGAAATAFAPAEYHLAQGRLCFLDGRIFLHLVYAGAGGNFSLFLRHADDSADSSAIEAHRFDAEQVAGFQHNALSAVLVTGESGDTAVQLARSAARSL
jgi:anti-sigma factor RsiW